jgi:CPA2 family monovalent cation:H+ antiporter-2
MEHGHILGEALLLFALAIVLVVAVRRVHLPPILGYLAVGLLAGPHGFGWLAFDQVTLFLAELGIVFLLFTIGLEFSWPLLMSMRRDLLGVGGLQVAGGTAAGLAIAMSFGEPWQTALILGAATAMSSTAIVLKQLAEQLELGARHGRLSVGILLFQDLAAIPFLIMIPILAAGDGDLAGPLGLALAKGVAAFVIIILLGRRLLPRVLHYSAAAQSAEVFTLTVLFLALATAWITSLFGLSLALGAFLAGMLLGETHYRHQIESDARPFRDLLMGLFFVAVGMELDLTLLPQIWLETLVLTAGIVLGKGLLIILLVRAIGHSPIVALRTGITLGHGGEFGIALLALALAHGLFGHETVQPVLAAMIVSMLIAAVLVRHNADIARAISPRGFLKGQVTAATALREGTESLEQHVIIVGFGRLGQNVAALLKQLEVDYVALDLQPEVVNDARDAGEPVYFGDATHRSILGAAGIRRARVLVIGFNEPSAVRRTLRAARDANPDLYIIVRARDDRDLDALIEAGANRVIPEPLEGSMSVAAHLLRRLDFADSDIERLIDRVRENQYCDLRRFFHGGTSGSDTAFQTRLHTVALPTHAWAVHRRLDALGLDAIGVSVLAIRRRGVRGDQPLGETELMKGDLLVLEGTPEALERAETHLLRG